MTVEFLLCMSTSTNLVVAYLLIFTFSVLVSSYLSLFMHTFYYSLLMHAFCSSLLMHTFCFLLDSCQGCSLLYLMGHQRNNARGGRG